MSVETATPESSAIETPAAVVAAVTPEFDISRGALVDLTPEQRKDYKATGNLPTAVKKEEPAASPALGESGTPEKQVVPKEPKGKISAEDRIAQLEADRTRIDSNIERIRAQAAANKPKSAESESAKSVPVQQHSTKPTTEDKNPDGTFKYGTAEEFEEARLEWMWEQKEAKKAQEAQAAAQTNELDAKLEKARSRYENLDEVVLPAVNAIIGNAAISPVIKQMLYDSEITPDLIYALASNDAEFQEFLKLAKTNPGKAIRLVAITESLTIQELEGKSAPKEAPAIPKTQAPKPPAEVGGKAATPPDSMQAALAASGGKLNADMKAEFLRRDLARLKK